jgi:hypothetical protein
LSSVPLFLRGARGDQQVLRITIDNSLKHPLS